MLKILLGVASLIGFFFLGNAERHEMKLPPVVYWFTWIGGGVAGTVYVGTQIGGPVGFMVGLVLAGAFIAAVSWSLRMRIGPEQQDSPVSESEKKDSSPIP
jgi:hypothetical protein